MKTTLLVVFLTALALGISTFVFATPVVPEAHYGFLRHGHLIGDGPVDLLTTGSPVVAGSEVGIGHTDSVNVEMGTPVVAGTGAGIIQTEPVKDNPVLVGTELGRGYPDGEMQAGGNRHGRGDPADHHGHQPAAVPEPATILLLAAGLVGIFALKRRMRR